MGIFDDFMENIRKPQGLFGRLLVRGMNITHHERTNWGLQYVTILEDSIILDIGCGGGRTIKKLSSKAPRGKIYGIDISKESARVAEDYNRKLVKERKVEVKVAGVSEIPFGDEFFDLVTAVETHIYWPCLGTDLFEVLRVLKPCGVLLIVCGEYLGSRFDERNRGWANSIGMNLHTLDEIKDTLFKVGFIDVDVFENFNRGWFCAIGKKRARHR